MKPMWPLVLLMMTMSLLVLQGGHRYSEDEVDAQVDEIVSDPAYQWMEEGAARRAPDLSGDEKPVAGGGTGSAKPGARPPESSDGCGYDPRFQRDDIVPGCGNTAPGCDLPAPRCDCAPGMTPSCGSGPGGCAPVVGGLGPIANVLGYTIAGLAFLVLLYFLVKTVVAARSDSSATSNEAEGRTTKMEIESVNAFEPAHFLMRAETSAQAGDYKKAVGFCYLGALCALSTGGFVRLDKSHTNREILRRARRTVETGGVDLLRSLIALFEQSFFGMVPVSENEWLRGRQLLTDLLSTAFRQSSSGAEHDAG